jgi:hypothetical protein
MPAGGGRGWASGADLAAERTRLDEWSDKRTAIISRYESKETSERQDFEREIAALQDKITLCQRDFEAAAVVRKRLHDEEINLLYETTFHPGRHLSQENDQGSSASAARGSETDLPEQQPAEPAGENSHDAVAQPV